MRIELDKSSKVKLYHQLYTAIARAIDDGILAPDERLPSIRAVSEEHGVSRNTVTKAYGELERDGYVYALSKSGFFVKNPSAAPSAEASGERTVPEDDGIPTVESILRERAADSQDGRTPASLPMESSGGEAPSGVGKLGIVLNSGDVISTELSRSGIASPEEAFAESFKTAISERKHFFMKSTPKGDSRGEDLLRVAIAVFLFKFHKINANPAHIVVGSDMLQLIFNIFSLNELRIPSWNLHGLLQLAERSIDREKDIRPSVLFLNRPDPRIRNVFAKSGFQAAQGGIADLEGSCATIAFSYDEHGPGVYEWAAQKDYRYIAAYDTSTVALDSPPFPYDSECDKVIYLASFSRWISKVVNISFAVLPKKLAESYAKRYEDFGCSLPLLDQLALTDFLMKDKLLSYLSNLEQL